MVRQRAQQDWQQTGFALRSQRVWSGFLLDLQAGSGRIRSHPYMNVDTHRFCLLGRLHKMSVRQLAEEGRRSRERWAANFR
jgi:hypothetical protein